MWDFIQSVRRGPEDMCQVWDEGAVLLSLVLARKPHKILEIGVRKGGSMVTMAEALAHLEHHQLVAPNPMIDGVDPEPQVEVAPKRQHLRKYLNVITGSSPEDVPKKLYDLIHIDGDHQYDAVVKDLDVAHQCSHPETVMILHDSNYPDVQRALEDFQAKYPDTFVIKNWTKRPERSDDWGGQALIMFKPQ